MNRPSLLVLALFSVLSTSNSQSSLDCPLGWFTYQENCYEFIKDPLALYEEAEKICRGKGAALVSVNTEDEHAFINQQLRTIDIARLYNWWTSGTDIDNKVKWMGDGEFADPTLNHWLSVKDRQNVAIHIVYKFYYPTSSYGWVKQFRNVKSSYICEIPKSEIHRLVQDQRDFTFGTDITDPDNVLMGPEFIIHPNNIVVTERSSTASLECVAKGNPQPQYRWYKGTSLQQEIVPSVHITITNGKLTFHNVTESETAGVYQCQAYNQFGSALSDLTSVTYGYLHEYSNVAPGSVNASQYQGTYLNCNPPSHKPAASFQWMKQSRHGLEFLMPELNNYYFMSQGGNLFFSEVQASDTGFYFCSVTLSAGQLGILATDQPTSDISKAIPLQVTGQTAADYPPEIHDGFPVVYPQNPVRGMTISIECLAYGSLPLIYSWTRKGGKKMPDRSRTEDLNRVLVIENVQLEDEGTYECTVRSRSRTNSKEYTLLIGAKPYFVSPLKNIHADINSELTWRCETIAVPRATYTWYKNSVQLQPIQGEIEIVSNVLKIKNLDPARDNGMYQCQATNTHGSSFSGAQLRVLSIKPSFLRNPLPVTMYAAVNGNFTIQCRPEAAPTPEITWLKDGGQLGQRQGLEILYNGDLRISGAQQLDAGLYTCQATNVNGKDQSSCRVTVTDSMQMISRPTDTRVDYNNTAFLQCDVSYDRRYDLIYRWTMNGHPINIQNDTHYRLGQRSNVKGLYIHYSDYRHTGYYECQAITTGSMVRAGATLTVTGPPGEPSGVYADVLSRTPHSIRLKWTVPPDHGSPVKFYIIESKTVLNNKWRVQVSNIKDEDALIQDTAQTDRRTWVVTGLKPHNDYYFRVSAINGYYGIGPPSIPTASYHLDGAAPVVAPQKVAGNGGTVGVLTISWTPLSPEDQGGRGVGYIVCWRRKDSTSAYKKVVKQGVNITQHVEDVGLENYYLPYEVMVGAYNEYGIGPNSTVAIAYSAEGMPTYVPKNVNGYEINSTAIYITWDPVPNRRLDMKGIIVGFELNVEDFNDPYRKSGTTYLYGEHTGGTVIGLEPNSDYWVTVQVFNSAGESNPSERQKISTFLSAPFLYPEYVTISSHGSDSVAVSWRGISTGLLEESIQGYKLEYWPRGENFRAAKTVVTEKVTNAVIYGIQKNEIYSLRVLGYSRGGDGKKSPTQYFTLGGHVPLDPTTSFTIQVGGTAMVTPSIVLVLLMGAFLWMTLWTSVY